MNFYIYIHSGFTFSVSDPKTTIIHKASWEIDRIFEIFTHFKKEKL